MSATRIALFNHKGGVSKTTTAFNLAWKIAELGHRVVVADTDPQCNMTGLVLGYKGASLLETFYDANPTRNIYAGLSPAFESRPSPILPVDCVELDQRPGMFLLPGHIRLSEYETTLGIAQELSGSIQALQNLPGSIAHLLNITAEAHQADFVVIDMSPGLGSVNQNLLATSDYFLVPTAPDFFSVMAIDSLSRVIPRWNAWARQASTLDILANAAYPFPAPSTKFLGSVVQNYRPRAGAPAASFQKWIDELEEAIRSRLVPVMAKSNMLLDAEHYRSAGLDDSLILSKIPDFNSLVALSQQHQKPVFALDENDIDRSGVVLEGTLRNRDQFNELFDHLAKTVLALSV